MRYSLILVLMLLAMAGCKTVHYQPAEVLNRQNNITILKDRIDLARANEIDVLAPNHFAKADEQLQQAVKEAQTSEDANAGNETAGEGLKTIVAAEEAAGDARTILQDALKRRARALAVHAHLLYEEEFAVLEKELIDAARAIENGDKKIGLEKNLELANRFGKLEITALKANVSEIAEKAYEQALEANAQKLAPKTLKAAKSELDIARKIIELEKENFDKAQFHAEQARYLAMRAKFIAELVTGFKKEKLSDEQVILWYQTQLNQIHNQLPTVIKFDKSNNDVVESFAAELASISSDLKRLEAKNLANEAYFKEITKLFSDDEAEVVRRGDDLVIRAYGFYFPVGKSELYSRNFELLNKIVTAIQKFPNSEIEVEGHTDSTGSKKINKRLSDERSNNIADFLIKVAKIDANRVKSVGVGDERPIAPNETAEGRTKNRRIDVIIKNAR